MKLGVISVTKQGDLISEKLKEKFDINLYSKNNLEYFNLSTVTKEAIENCDGLIYISSTGIAVRAIASFLKGKDVDPPVIVIDCSGKFVISLVSGHLGGANELTLKLANHLNAQPVITTATDNLGITAPDVLAKDNNLIIDDLKKAKKIAALLVEGKKVAFIDEENKIPIPCGYVNNLQKICGLILVTNRIHRKKVKNLELKLKKDEIYQVNEDNILRLIRKNVILGIGCRKNFDKDKMIEIVKKYLKAYNIDIRAVKKISTVEVKAKELAILNLSEVLNVPLEIHSIEEIKKVQHKYSGSDFVEKTIGVRAVSEPCTELSGGNLLTGKLSCDGMTLCIGEDFT
ncbi:MAG: cobalt-precorrin 5A hydrolase [Clostridiaceae bacterium]